MVYKCIGVLHRELQGEVVKCWDWFKSTSDSSLCNPRPCKTAWLARGPSDFCWQNSATVCAPGSLLWLLLHPWALCLQPTFQGELAVILVPLKPRGCNLWLSAAYRWFNHQCTGANRHRGRCCPSPFKPPLLRSQWQWSQVGSCSPCQQPLGLYPASFLSHFPLLVCWRGANSKRAQVHRPTHLIGVSPPLVRDRKQGLTSCQTCASWKDLLFFPWEPLKIITDKYPESGHNQHTTLMQILLKLEKYGNYIK